MTRETAFGSEDASEGSKQIYKIMPCVVNDEKFFYDLLGEMGGVSYFCHVK